MSRDSVVGIHWSVLLGQYCSSEEGDRENNNNNTAQPVQCGDVDGVCRLQHCSKNNDSQSLTVTGPSDSSVSLSAVQSQ
ncbi:hypothetical protein VZT92_018862 [Zoarces viviparus]|uniref:Uncharacterized protein n=1 Tax=Zoarces viviparus TaxID=48416 RepID=A0AAW1EIH5_ZOAVI